MRVNEFLAPNDVSINLRVADKPALLQGLAQVIAESLPISVDEIARSLAARERLGGTSTGNGVALPHARMPQLMKPAAHFARLGQPIDYDSVDGLPVDLVFMMLLPDGADSKSLQALACAARKLRDEGTLRLLRRAGDMSGLYSALIA